MNTTAQAPEQLFGYDVIDSGGNKLGSVDNVWVDDATDELEFIGVKTGMVFGKTHVIPTVDAEADPGNNSIRVPYAEDQIKGAPSFGAHDELSPEQESEVYSYYGLDRSTAPSPSGLPEGGTASTGTTRSGTTGSPATGTLESADDERRIQLAEEELQVGKRQVEAGRARLRKVVHTEHVSEPVELRHEELDIERVPVADGEVAPGAFQEGEIEIPIMREEPVAAKEARVTGEVRLGKDVKTETRTVEGDVRREDVDIDRDHVAAYTDGPQPND